MTAPTLVNCRRCENDRRVKKPHRLIRHTDSGYSYCLCELCGRRVKAYPSVTVEGVKIIDAEKLK